MGSTPWDDGNYYGRKSRNNFRRLDKLLAKQFATCKDDAVDDTTLDRILKIISKQNNIAHSITKIVDSLTLNKRMYELERLIHLIPADVLAKWIKTVPQHERDSWR